MTCLLRIILPTRKFLISPTLPCLWSKVGKVGIYIHTDNIRTIVVERKTDRWKITSLSSSGLSIYLFIVCSFCYHVDGNIFKRERNNSKGKNDRKDRVKSKVFNPFRSLFRGERER